MAARLDAFLLLIMHGSDFEPTTSWFDYTEVVQFYTQCLDGLIFGSNFELCEGQRTAIVIVIDKLQSSFITPSENST
jgi:hypothetical protein